MLLIVRLTIWEALRRKVLLASGLMTAAFLLLFWLEVSHQPRQPVAGDPLGALIAAISSLALGAFFSYFVIAFFSVFSVSGAISSEIESGMLATIVPHPLHRWEIVMGKWLGFAIVQLIYVSILFFCIVAIIAAYHGSILPPTQMILLAWVLFILEAWVLSAVTLLGSVVLSTLANGIVVALGFTATFLAGAIAQLPFGQPSPVVNQIATIASLVLPTDNLYRRAVYELAGGGQSLIGANSSLGPFGAIQEPSNTYLLYAAVYLVGVLVLATRLFSRRDI